MNCIPSLTLSDALKKGFWHCQAHVQRAALNINHIFEAWPQTVHPLSLELSNMSERDQIKLTLQSVSKVNPLDILSQSSLCYKIKSSWTQLDSPGWWSHGLYNIHLGKERLELKAGILFIKKDYLIKYIIN